MIILIIIIIIIIIVINITIIIINITIIIIIIIIIITYIIIITITTTITTIVTTIYTLFSVFHYKLFQYLSQVFVCLNSFHTNPFIWKHPVATCCYVYKCWISGKQCRPWSDAAFCGVWPGSTLFANTFRSNYLLFSFIYTTFLEGSS